MKVSSGGLVEHMDAWFEAKASAVEARLIERIELLEARLRALEAAGPSSEGESEPAPGTPPEAAKPSVSTAVRAVKLTPLEARLPAFTAAELKELCKAHGLAKTGVKADLVERLAKAQVDPMEVQLTNDYKLSELREACEARGLPTSGNKVDLARRLLK